LKSDDIHVCVAAVFPTADMYNLKLDSDGAGRWLERRNDRFENSTHLVDLMKHISE
jgi:hypothetical protein